MKPVPKKQFWQNICHKIICFNQPIKSHNGKLCLAAINTLYSLLSCHITFKLTVFIILLFVFIWCRSGEIVVGQVDFSSPPDRLSCKVWETFVNSVFGGQL